MKHLRGTDILVAVAVTVLGGLLPIYWIGKLYSTAMDTDIVEMKWIIGTGVSWVWAFGILVAHLLLLKPKGGTK